MIAPALALTFALTAQPPLDADRLAKDARDILSELVAADTSSPPGNEARAVKLIAARLKKAGIPYQITTFAPGRENVVARLKGDGSRKPILFLAHLDVVGTQDQTWTSPPHTLTEKDGFLVGRGSGDDLGMAAVDLALAIGLHAAHTPLRRDLIVAFTGDEESGGAGVRYVLEHAPETLQAEVAFNESGGPLLGRDGKVELVRLQMAQKLYADFTVTATGPTGHSSAPVPGNAITALGGALAAIGAYQFPERFIPVTRAYFGAAAKAESPELGEAMGKLAAAAGPLPEDALAVIRRSPGLAAQLHTTCVPTLVSGGTRANALPARAEANVNCRLLPGDTVASVQADLQRVAGPGVTVAPKSGHVTAIPVDPVPVDGLGPAAIAAAAGAEWPGAAVVPALTNGATDARALIAHGIPTYGILPIPLAEGESHRFHGIDERIPVSSLRTGVEFYERLVQTLNE